MLEMTKYFFLNLKKKIFSRLKRLSLIEATFDTTFWGRFFEFFLSFFI